MIVNGVEKMENIIIKNAKVNNLKNISIDIPINKFTCIIGVSGCGKSSLVYDTIFAESQRNFFESMTGNMFGQKIMDKPNVEVIKNLHPALNIAQKYYNLNPRSTVGTVSDISYYLRALFALIINYENGTTYKESFFSANNPSSYCKYCDGLGEGYEISLDLLIPDKNKSLREGAILYYKGNSSSVQFKYLEALCSYYNISMDTEFKDLSNIDIEKILYRKDELSFDLKFKTPKGKYRQKRISEKGVILELNEKLKDIKTPSTYANISKYLEKGICQSCKGKKLSQKVLSYKICNKDIADIESSRLCDILLWLDIIENKYNKVSIISEINQLSSQISSRLLKMMDLKLSYLTLNRSVPTLSGGEIQRIRISNQLNCSLVGLIYILDEPCKGLHFKDIKCVISSTKELVNRGNTVIAIEHNKQFIREAEKIIELGPVGGPNGGYIVDQNKDIKKFELKINFKKIKEAKSFFELKNINFRNIHNQSIKMPIGQISCITGVSGSGKSTLISVIEECFLHKRNIKCELFNTDTKFKKILKVDQHPIGKTPRSMIVTYLEIYDIIRELFANTEEAKENNLTSSSFSTNTGDGRCECCQGSGTKKIELNYLPDTYISCPECEGKRFKSEILEIKYKGLTISEILDESIDTIISIFKDNEKIYEKLKCMIDMGLGYLKLGQMSMNLSGGEAQRIKLAKALGTKSVGNNLYILDEPTSGLNDIDIEKISSILLNLQKKGETIIIVEHNIEFILNVSDYLVDFGNKAGDDGGVIVAQGIPKEVLKNKNSSWFDVIESLKK